MRKQTVLSNDVTGLYVEVEPERAGEEVMAAIVNSKYNIETNTGELAKFIACCGDKREIQKLGLSDVVHTRKYWNKKDPGFRSREMRIVKERKRKFSKSERENIETELKMRIISFKCFTHGNDFYYIKQHISTFIIFQSLNVMATHT